MMMILLLQQTIIGLILTIFVISSTKADYSKNCSRTCRIGNQNRDHDLPYPFGFSEGCPIQLNCSHAGNVSIGEFEVQNVTGDSLLINLPAKCNRPINDIAGLFGHNYALTWQNGLLLKNCTTTQPKNCVIPAGIMESRLGSQVCDIRDNISCYSVEHQALDFMTFDNLSSTSCSVLYSSIAVDLRNNSNMFSLEFQTVELGWWLDGKCNCSTNASCTPMSLAGGGEGFRCSCNEGFEGDGFADGGGCRKARKEDEDSFITTGFYISIGIGFIVGFWGVCGTLIFNSSWRYAFFKLVKNIEDWLFVVSAVYTSKLKRQLQI